MDQFSHDLTLALEETSLLFRACGVSRWGSRRRTRSTGNLPCAPQPTEDSSSSPTDVTNNAHSHTTPQHVSANIDGLDMHNIALPASDSDEKHHGNLPLRLPCKSLNAAIRLGTLESDSLNETNFSPARFYKPSSRRKRKIKRMSMEFDLIANSNVPTSPHSYTESPIQPPVLTSGLTTMMEGTGGATPMTGTVRKRLLKTDNNNCSSSLSRNQRTTFFFCGKRKRSNRDRYQEHDHALAATKAAHSSSMPRHANIDDYRMRPRSYSSTSKPHSDRLLPLNKGLLSKIERISQLQKTEENVADITTSKHDGANTILPSIINETNVIIDVATTVTGELQLNDPSPLTQSSALYPKSLNDTTTVPGEDVALLNTSAKATGKHQQQSKLPHVDEQESYSSGALYHHHHQQHHHQHHHAHRKKNQYNLLISAANMPSTVTASTVPPPPPLTIAALAKPVSTSASVSAAAAAAATTKAMRHRLRRAQQLKFGIMSEGELQHSMDCTDLTDFLSSSSLSSSSDSEDDHRPNDTDREGDDELTDWPGNEFGPGGFKYDPKRKLTKKSTLPQIRSDDTIGEDDTLMSGSESITMTATAIGGIDILPTTTLFEDKTRLPAASEPIRIATQRNVNFGGCIGGGISGGGFGGVDSGGGCTAIGNNTDIDNNMCDDDDGGMPPIKQIESEMSGETSNPFLSSSPPLQASEVREIRAGCRRIKSERPGFSIKLSVNERLARFLQDPRQTQIRLPDIEIYEHDSLLNLATLYSLQTTLENGCAVLTKTSKTTQTVNITTDQRSMQNRRHFFSDFKRRCYDGNESLLPRK